MKLLALIAMLAFSATAGWPVPALVVLGLLAVATPRWEIPLRPLLLGSSIVAALVLMLMGPPPAGHTFGGDVGYSYSGGLILGAFLAVLLARKEDSSLWVMALSMLLTLVGGQTQNNFPFAWFVLAQTLALAWVLRRRVPGGGLGRRGAMYALLALGLAGLAGGGLAWSLRFSEIAFNQLLAQGLSNMFSTSAAFASQTSLSAVRQMQTGRQVVVRVITEKPFAHLAGRRYVTYAEQRWDADQTASPAPRQGDFFQLVDGAQEWVDRVELNPSGLETLFAPLDGVGLAGPSALDRDVQGVAHLPAGMPFTGSYQVARGKPVWPSPGPETLALPDKLPPVVAKLAAELAGGKAPYDQALSIQGFLQEEFEYGFGYPFKPDEDPVGQFLEKRPAAHCELFASSMVLMLRTRGIPSRYVTGFLVRERSALGGYYVGRVKDAHAWVEAWFPDRGWTTFDPTPPSALPSEALSNFEEGWDLVVRRWTQLKGWMAAYGGWVILLLLLVLVRRHVRFRLPRFHRVARPVDVELERMQKLLAQLERKVGPRPRCVSLRDWAREVPAAAPFLELYGLVRYRDDRPSPEQLAELERLLEAVPAERANTAPA